MHCSDRELHWLLLLLARSSGERIDLDLARGLFNGSLDLAAGPTAPRLDEDQLSQAVAASCYAEDCEDAALAGMLGVRPESLAGVWPEYSLLRHSCTPNTIHTIISGKLILRAAGPILQGDELFTDYLGFSRFAPVAERRARLKGRHGFFCRCHRCVTEQARFPTKRYQEESLAADHGPLWGFIPRFWSSQQQEEVKLQPLPPPHNTALQLVYEQSKDLKRDVQEAVTAVSSVSSRRSSALARLMSLKQQVEVALERAELAGDDAALMWASNLDLLLLLADFLDDTGALTPVQHLDLIRDVAQLLDLVARGTELQLYWAVRYLSQVSAMQGRGSEAAQSALVACGIGHTARYGRLCHTCFSKVLLERHKLVLANRLNSRLGVLAWDSQVQKMDEKV